LNALSLETSPYLKQHQNNPVNWLAWGETAWEKARSEDKLVLVSIGYSACHWCHVMEHESFEDDATAAIMNEHFVCIKVDREERPDVDQVYMEAVQTIHGSGGWPLNCFALPDGRPIHGGTYFRKEEWKKTLLSLHQFYKNKKTEAYDYASRLTKGLEQLRFNVETGATFNAEKMDSVILSWQNYFDVTEGGQDREPKFPLPNNYLFLLHFGAIRKNKFILNFVHLTLHKMARGGIYDQIGGGFARYSVDRYWHVPHFEKMLYDNAQLVSLYSAAYQLTKSEYYKAIIDDTIAFVMRELSHPKGGFFSALDADSEGVEGKFYTWTSIEFEHALLGENFKSAGFINHAKAFYQVTEAGNWTEEETNILKCASGVEDYCALSGLERSAFESDLQHAKQLLLKKRGDRVRPGLDDKILTSWNALMIKALVDAFIATGNISYLNEARTNYAFIRQQLWIEGSLYHTFHYGSEKAKVAAFLDDYVFLADAAVMLYQATFVEQYMLDSKLYIDKVLTDFADEKSGLFFYSGNNNETLFIRKHELYDNVIPASNSILATLMYKLSHYFVDDRYRQISTEMLFLMQSKFAGYPSGYSQWMQFQLLEIFGLKTICITGNESLEVRMQFATHYLPNVLFAGGENTTLPILKGKLSKGEEHIHICTESACMPALASVAEALKLL